MFQVLKYIQEHKANSNYGIIKAGFTLVELALVLVIIGLVIGGVMVGQDLIFSAKIRAQIKQVEEMETAYNTFKVKYNCTAGDCANATEFFGTTDAQGNAVNNGNGDGIIKGTYGAGASFGAGECIYPGISGEVSQLFMQMYLAGLSKDYAKGTLNVAPNRIGIEYPYAQFGNGTGFFVSCLGTTTPGWMNVTPLFLRQGNIIVIGASGDQTKGDGRRIGYAIGQFGVGVNGIFGYDSAAYLLNPIGIPVDASRMIDEKIDDSKPSTGKFGIIAGQTACDNSAASHAGAALLSAYPSSSVNCNVTAGKKIE
jgi:prepilin-type N-terminal cleavage/methylation domain-containing protein